MIVCSGKSVFEGIAIGPIHVYKKEEQSVKRTKVTDLDAEVARYTAAVRQQLNSFRLCTTRQ